MAPFYRGQFYLVSVKGELVFTDVCRCLMPPDVMTRLPPKKEEKKRKEHTVLSESACCEQINRGTTSFLLPRSASQLAACIRALPSSQADGCFSAD